MGAMKAEVHVGTSLPRPEPVVQPTMNIQGQLHFFYLSEVHGTSKRRSEGMKSVATLKKLLLSLVVVGAVGGVVSSGTFATFTASANVTGNTFATGTLDLTANPAEEVFVVTDMAPGDVKIDSLEIQNTGSLELRYGMTTATNNDDKGLANQLSLSVKELGGVASCDAVDFENDTLYSGSLKGANFAMNRVLGGGGSETLCFKVELPIETGNEFQGASTEVIFTFDAEQTKNNPA